MICKKGGAKIWLLCTPGRPSPGACQKNTLNSAVLFLFPLPDKSRRKLRIIRSFLTGEPVFQHAEHHLFLGPHFAARLSPRFSPCFSPRLN